MPKYLLISVTVVLLVFIAGLAGAIIYGVFTGRINLARLLSEPNGDASMSRFQLLIFTFVIAMSLFCVVVGGVEPKFPDLPSSILTLLGISGSSYVVSKAIQFTDPDGVKDRRVNVRPIAVKLAPKETQQFVATVAGQPASKVTWSTDAGQGVGTIDPATGLYTAGETTPTKAITVTATLEDETTGTGGVL